MPRRAFAQQPRPGAGRPRTAEESKKNTTMVLYATSAILTFLGLSYAAVPLYQMFCQATGYGGTTQRADLEQFKRMKPVEGARPVNIFFNADTADTMPWNFEPLQRRVKVVPGETALAFFRARNPSDKAVTGVSAYNVTPMKAGVHFHKIQCFCFEEQRLRPNEEIDMPIFFYVDPEFAQDPSMSDVRDITLSYTFFRTGAMDPHTGEWHDVEPEEDDASSDAAAKNVNKLEEVKEWTRDMVEQTGVQVSSSGSQQRE